MPDAAIRSEPSRSRLSGGDCPCLGEPSSLERFVLVQADRYPAVLEDLARDAGERACGLAWLPFVYPQLRGLGTNPACLHYGVDGLAEAQDYLRHTTLGARLEEALSLLCGLAGRRGLLNVLGTADALKVLACATLFERASAGWDCYGAAAVHQRCDVLLRHHFDGRRDGVTLSLLADWG